MSARIVFKNRNFAGLLFANTILGAAFPIQLILGGLAGLTLAPSPALATLPSSIQTFAGLLAAAPLSLLMGWLGRRVGFAVGCLLTLVGGVAGADQRAMGRSDQGFALVAGEGQELLADVGDAFARVEVDDRETPLQGVDATLESFAFRPRGLAR